MLDRDLHRQMTLAAAARLESGDDDKADLPAGFESSTAGALASMLRCCSGLTVPCAFKSAVQVVGLKRRARDREAIKLESRHDR